MRCCERWKRGGGWLGSENGLKITNGSFEQRNLILSAKSELNWLVEIVEDEANRDILAVFS